ncbi:MAG: response regulator [Bryobacteraceae bacterium]
MTETKPLREILLVEDHPNDIELTLEALSAHHMANPVVVVEDGAQALDYLFYRGKYTSRSPGLPILILLDLKLPKVSGLEVLAALKADAVLSLVPVVMLTASKEEFDVVRSYQLGVNAYVVKPLVFDAFLQAVRQIGGFWGIVNEPPPPIAAQRLSSLQAPRSDWPDGGQG